MTGPRDDSEASCERAASGLAVPAPNAPAWLRPALLLLFGAAFAQYAWNLFAITPLTGYDGPAHAGYIATIALDHRLPEPREGWSTFHPPLYYLFGAAVWTLFDAASPRVLVAALRSLSLVALFASAIVAQRLLAERGAAPFVQLVAVAIVLLAPVSQLAGTSIGNEAFGVGLASLAVPAVLRLQRDASDRRAAITAGALAGLAMATKYTGLFVAVGCLVPYARRSAWPHLRTTFPWLLAALCLLGGPVYLRNLALTGSPVPMTRDQGFHAKVEEGMTLRPRALADFGPPSPNVLLRPTLFHVDGEPQPGVRWNESMQNVWGLGYATLWYDGTGLRVQARFHRDGIVWGPLLSLLGLVPTALLIFGFGLALRDGWHSRGASVDAPLVVMSLVGLALYCAFTVRAPAIVAAKGSYLLPLVVPAALFFGRATEGIRGGLRGALLSVSAAAALLAGVVFTTDLVFPPIPVDRVLQSRAILDRVYPTAHIGVGVDRLTGARPAERPARQRPGPGSV